MWTLLSKGVLSAVFGWQFALGLNWPVLGMARNL